MRRSISLDLNRDYKTIWKDCLDIIKETVSPLSYNTWFLPIKPIELADSTLKIQVPSHIFIDWIEDHFNSTINKAVTTVLGESGKLIYMIVNDPEESEKYESENGTPISLADLQPAEQQKPDNSTFLSISANSEPQEDLNFSNNLQPKYQFENFIKGESNQLARAAAVAVSENPGETSFNPLFIYGGVGLGKTHLIQAIGNRILSKNPNKKVLYMSSSEFSAKFIDAILVNKLNEFSNFYQRMDVLIIDDIQFLMNKEKTQDLFFHIFNSLHQLNKQIILSSDKPPKDLNGMNERLISRFQWGLSADIQPPDFETRMAILKNKCDKFGIRLEHGMLEYIAYNVTSNIRELEGCLIKILASKSLSNKEIEMNLVKKIVKDVSTTKQVNVSIDQITKAVCEYLKVEENKVREKNRRKEVVMARQIAMYLAKEITKSSLKTIGLHFGGRDHSTVIHSCDSVTQMIMEDHTIKEIVDTLKNKIELGTT
ncbi:MAG TPA: chromosomal replication initiator protein DnaA [Melioribacteraceae bacterium]|nr:chromosomal replication initiator protein DnaA [Melioribacteraceae bacterium]